MNSVGKIMLVGNKSDLLEVYNKYLISFLVKKS
jgi:hypothetical protein